MLASLMIAVLAAAVGIKGHGMVTIPVARKVDLSSRLINCIVLAHANNTIQKTGTQQAALCGVNVTKSLASGTSILRTKPLYVCRSEETDTYHGPSDPYEPIENALAKVHTDYNCNAYLCKGYQYTDNTAYLQTYKAGQVVTFHVDLVAAHKPGWAVSVFSAHWAPDSGLQTRTVTNSRISRMSR